MPGCIWDPGCRRPGLAHLPACFPFRPFLPRPVFDLGGETGDETGRESAGGIRCGVSGVPALVADRSGTSDVPVLNSIVAGSTSCLPLFTRSALCVLIFPTPPRSDPPYQGLTSPSHFLLILPTIAYTSPHHFSRRCWCCAFTRL